MKSDPVDVAEPPAILAPLLGEGTRRVYPPTALLFAEGDPPGAALVVTVGRVAIATSVGGEVAVCRAGQLIGELSALDGLPRSASATAVTQVEVRAIPPIRFAELLAAHGDIARYVRGLVTARARPGPIARGPAGQAMAVDRLARWVLERDQANQGDWIGVSSDEMAAELEVSQEMLSRAIDHLVGRGAVALDRGRLLIRSRDALVQLSDPYT